MYTNKIKDILISIKPSIEKYFGKEFVTDGILESVELMELIAEIEEQFDIEIPPQLIIPDNFETIDTIDALIQTVLNK
ncbi:MAG: acyl carrier protein [Lachnospiraceae bacterium]